MPESTNDPKKARFCASTGLPVSQTTGAVKMVIPSMCSESASVSFSGK